MRVWLLPAAVLLRAVQQADSEAAKAEDSDEGKAAANPTRKVVLVPSCHHALIITQYS